jgi:hypothetical protein
MMGGADINVNYIYICNASINEKSQEMGYMHARTTAMEFTYHNGCFATIGV